MTYSRSPSPRPPLDEEALGRLLITYVGRYATTRARLRAYLERKLHERGWEGEGTPPIEALVDRAVRNGYVDDLGFATARSASLARRGYGHRRRRAALAAVGIDADDIASVEAAEEMADEDREWTSLMALARRRRLGPFSRLPGDPDARRRDFGAIMRAGHSPALAKRLFAIDPAEIDVEAQDSAGNRSGP